MKKICVRMPNWIGDLVMATPILKDLRDRYPDAEITALVKSPFDELLKEHKYIDRVVSFQKISRFSPRMKTGESLITWLRKERFDMGILTTNSFSTAYLFWKGGVKRRIGFVKKSRFFFLTDRIPFPQNKAERHLVQTYKCLLKPLKITDSQSMPELFVPKKEKPRGEIWIGINPGAAYGSAKCWLPDRFRKVIENFIKEMPRIKIFVFGDRQTRSLVDEICQNLQTGVVVNLAEKTTLSELSAYIGSLDAFLTNDSGPMHIAAALKTPLVALFGSTNEIATGPYQWGTVIHKHVSCSPCYKRTCPIDFRCMKSIEVDEVTFAMKRLLMEPAKKTMKQPLGFVEIQKPRFMVSEGLEKGKREEAVVILAGGKGRRLGLDYPKGCLKLGEKSLYQILLEKCKGKKVWILTSLATHEKTKKHIEELGFSANFAMIRSFPTLNQTEESPEGNGALFETITFAKEWQEDKDIEMLHIVPIDNPLVWLDDPAMILKKGEDLVVKAIKKRSFAESIGTLVEVEKHLHVIEYFESHNWQEYALDRDGSYIWDLGYSGIFSCSREFFQRMAKVDLPWHKVKRGDLDILEKLVIDAFPYAEKYRVVLAKRESEFLPIKELEDREKAKMKLGHVPKVAIGPQNKRKQ